MGAPYLLRKGSVPGADGGTEIALFGPVYGQDRLRTEPVPSPYREQADTGEAGVGTESGPPCIGFDASPPPRYLEGV